jgi:soluble lytic murein transglycosylase-like protein
VIEPIATGASSAEAPASLARVEQLQALAAKASEATSPSGQESFAAALRAATESSPAATEQAMQPEAIPSAEVEPMPSAEAEAIPGAEVEGMSGAAMSGATTAIATAALEQAPGTVTATPADPTTATLPYSQQSALAAATPTAYAGSPAAYPVDTGQMVSTGQVMSAGQTGATPLQAAETQPAAPTGAAHYEAAIQQAAIRNGVEPALLKGLIEQESGFDPNAHSSAGALGLTQLMPSTAASLGVSEPLDPTQSIEGGARLLGQLLRQFGGNVSYALAAYNAGAGAVQQYGGIPPYPETEAYVSKVLANARAYGGAG